MQQSTLYRFVIELLPDNLALLSSLSVPSERNGQRSIRIQLVLNLVAIRLQTVQAKWLAVERSEGALPGTYVKCRVPITMVLHASQYFWNLPRRAASCSKVFANLVVAVSMVAMLSSSIFIVLFMARWTSVSLSIKEVIRLMTQSVFYRRSVSRSAPMGIIRERRTYELFPEREGVVETEASRLIRHGALVKDRTEEHHGPHESPDSKEDNLHDDTHIGLVPNNRNNLVVPFNRDGIADGEPVVRQPGRTLGRPTQQQE